MGGYANAMAALWRSYGEAMAKLWAVMGKLWGSYGKCGEAMAKLRDAMWKLWGSYAALLGSYGEAMGQLPFSQKKKSTKKQTNRNEKFGVQKALGLEKKICQRSSGFKRTTEERKAEAGREVSQEYK